MAAEDKKTCATVAAHLVAITEGHAPDEIRRHLEACEGCARLARGFAAAWRDPAPPGEENASPSFFPRLMDRIAADRALGAGRGIGLQTAWRFLKPAAAAALFVGAVFAGFLVGSPPSRAAATEAAVSPVVLAGLESIPPGSAADFYVAHPVSAKEETP